MYSTLAILALFIFGYSLIAGRVDKMAISGPIVFTAFGLLVGGSGLGVLDIRLDGETLQSLAELTLAVVLFTDAAKTDLTVLSKNSGVAARLLLIGLPLTIGLGYLVGRFLFPELPVLEVAILATMLAPTDAALGSAVVSNPEVPAQTREVLNVESGLNDGICVPILFVFLALAEGQGASGLALRLVTEEIGIGLAVGLVITASGVMTIAFCSERGWFGEVWTWVTIIALAFACFSLAQLLGGSGFIACFSGGLVFGAMMKKSSHKAPLLEMADGVGETLSLITWVLFGAAVVGPALALVHWQIVLYALLSLTLVRMLPVFLVLFGTGLETRGKLFIGWFGPRGLASVVFIIIVFDEFRSADPTLALVVVTTVVMSILAHGITANPLSSRLASAVGGERKGS